MCYAVVIDWLGTVYAVSVSYGCLLFARMIFLTAIFVLFVVIFVVLLWLVSRLYVVLCLFLFVPVFAFVLLRVEFSSSFLPPRRLRVWRFCLLPVCSGRMVLFNKGSIQFVH